MKKYITTTALVLSLITMTACSSVKQESSTSTPKTEQTSKLGKFKEKAKDYLNKAKEKTEDAINKVEDKINDLEKGTESTPSNFSGAYQEVTGAADFTSQTVSPGYNYGSLDSLGRPTWATAEITPADYKREKNEKRAPIKVNPIGWPKKNPKVTITHPDGSTYTGYFWNRSHMIADSLGGEPTKENLVTGTRPQNVGGRSNDGGMAYMETKIRNYFDEGNTGNVKYSVENHYNGDDLLPDYTVVNALSDEGKINERVVVYNVANGWNINYKTAEITQK